MTNIELSTDSLAGAVAADSLGVQRIELCSAGALGGLTPGPGLLTRVLALVRTEVHALIRPREGGFRYSPAEVDVMLADVGYAVSAGAAGVVVGALTPAGDLDVPVLKELVAAAAGRAVTFHRALDVCREPVAAVETLVELGFSRVLSSGQAVRALDGAAVLAALVRAAGAELAVMACGGIRPHNARAVVEATGVRDLHAAPRREVPGDSSTVDFGGHAEFDVETARELVRLIGEW